MESSIFGQQSFDSVQEMEGHPGVRIFTKTSIDKTTPNEDALAVIPLSGGGYVFAVADGAGGHPKGEEASYQCLYNIQKSLESSNKKDCYRKEILDGLEGANQALIESGVGCKTTVSILEYGIGYARSYQVGDSTSFICSQRGNVKFRSISHSPVGYAVEAEVLSEEEALVHPHLNIVSNLVGDTEMKIEIGPRVDIAKRDTLFLASDGLFDNFQLQSIVEVVRKGSLDEISTNLYQLLTRQIFENPVAKQDDLCFILFQPHNP